eukprot:5497485-Amphidinium_carterae.1
MLFSCSSSPTHVGGAGGGIPLSTSGSQKTSSASTTATTYCLLRTLPSCPGLLAPGSNTNSN